MKKILIMMIGLLLFGCGSEDNGNNQVHINESYELSGVVDEVRENSLLIETVDGELYDVGFKKEYFEELSSVVKSVGTQITVSFDGDVMESYPMQIRADAVIEYTEVVYIKGQVTELMDGSFQITAEDDLPYVIHIDYEGIDIGDVVTVSFSGEVMESYPMQINGFKVTGIEKGQAILDDNKKEYMDDKIVQIDQREMISGAVGFFPTQVFTLQDEIIVRVGEKFAIELEEELTVKFPLAIEVIGQGEYGGKYYLGIEAFDIGEHILKIGEKEIKIAIR